jgi:hypothetical protein
MFATWRQKKGLANPTKGFLRFKKKNSPHLEEKKLEVARFRKCVPLGCQNYAGSQKNLLVHQDSHHLLLINAEDPCHYTYLRNLKKQTLERGIS